MFTFRCIYLIITVICIVQHVFSQNLPQPDIACPQFFEYVCSGGTCFGKITLPNAAYAETTTQVEFSQRNPVTTGYYGSINNLDDNETIKNKLKEHKPLLLRVDFPLLNELPKLTKMVVNGIVVCSASAYPNAGAFFSHVFKNSFKITYDSFTNLPHHETLPLQRFPQLDNVNLLNTSPNGALPFRPTQPEIKWPLDRESRLGSLAQPDNAYRFNPLPNGVPTRSEITWSPTRESASGPLAQLDNEYRFNLPLNGAPLSKPTKSVITQFPIPIEQTPQPIPFQPSMPIDNRDICGQEDEKPAFTPFILGGTVLRPGQLPWLTAVYSRTIIFTTFICGGTLISTYTVLSAAHCFKQTELKANNIAVSLGRYNLSKSMEPSGVMRDIQKLITSPEYDPENFPYADIALLIMSDPVSFTDFIKPICLWAGSEDFSQIINEIGYVAGWGGDSSGSEISPVPKMAPAKIVSESVCRRSSSLLAKLVSSRTFCAGQQNGVGPCVGDSGGGLMIKRQGRWFLRGVVSGGQTEYSRCNLEKFVIYCDVAKYSSFVQSEMV